MSRCHNPPLCPDVISRFQGKFRQGAASACWPWQAGKHERGYGVFTIDRVDYKATHVALVLDGRLRPPSPGDCALHSCHNPACVNPAHLRWGTMAENNNDKMEAGRFEPHIGSSNGRAILSDDDVREIRGAAGSSREVAARYGVSSKQIREIRRGEAWRHVA